MIIRRISMISGKEASLDLPITEEQWKIWNSDDSPLIQDLFPHLTSDQREFILTGITKEEWDEVFNEDTDITMD